MITDLYTYRSYARCVSEGYRFLARNLSMVCKVMTPYFLVLSLLRVLSNVVNTHANVAMLAGEQIDVTEVVAAIALAALCIIAYVVALMRLYRMFKRVCGIKGRRTIKWGRVQKAIFRHLGKVVGTTLLSLFVWVVISAVVYLPYVVLIYAYFSSVEGRINFGDMALIPTSGYVIMIVVCTVCYTIINTLSVGFYASLMFLYGSVKTVDS